jgi:hypothetical protein
LPVFTLREIAALKSLEPYEHPNIVSIRWTGNFARLRIIETSMQCRLQSWSW